MKLFNNIIKFGAIALLAAAFVGCKEDELVKPNALLSESSLTFEATNAEPQELTVASDADWMIDVDSDWITVDPMSGTNTVKVHVEVEDNVDANGALAAPRQGLITIANKRGYSITTVIYQNGDTYLGAGEYNLADIAKLEKDTRAKVKETQVVALTSDGFIASDESACLYILGNVGNVKIGDKITMNGAAGEVQTVKTFVSDEVTVLSNSEVVYPEAKDITSSVADYNPGKIEYVKAEGTLINKGLRVGSTLSAVTMYNAGIDIESVNMHKVVVSGYAIIRAAKTVYFVPVSFEDNGVDEELTFYPVKYQIRKTPVNFTTASFSAEGKIEPISGLGYIQYVPFDLKNTNNNNKYALDVSDSSPRVIGPWPGDYWLFYCYGAVKAGSVMHISFEARVSGTGHKYWMIEYLDGNVWKPAEDTKKATDVDCEYTHAMNADGATNVQVSVDVKIKKNMDNCQFRFRCMANWQANGNGALDTRNGGSGRLSVTDTSSDTFQPQIIMVSEGDGVEIPDTDPIAANIVVSKDLLTFEGTPDAPAKFKVSSDYDYTLSASEDWLSLDVTEGAANEEKEVTVTCKPSDLVTLREAEIVIKSEDSKKTIHVVQSAAGGELEPFISIVDANSTTVLGQGAEFDAKVQANVDFETEISGDWISEVPVASTQALVETKTLRFKAAANLTGAPRVGTIRFYKGKIESVLTVNQDKFEPSIAVTSTMNSVPASGASLPVHIVANVDFTVDAPGVTLPVSSAKAGTYDLTIPVPANTGAPRKLAVTFKNSEYSYENSFVIWQAGATEVFSDDFSWVAPIVAAWNAADANKGKKVGDTVGSNGQDGEAPNTYSDATITTSFHEAFKAQGYEDLQPSKKVLYLQDQYLKLGRTGGNNNALKLPAVSGLTSATNVFIEFDHATMCQSDGTCDDAKMVVVIDGDGEFENGTKCSDILPVIQEKGSYRWTHSGAYIKGMTSSTRLVLVMYRVVMTKNSEGVYEYTGKYNFSVSGAGRLFIDNIKITK